MVIDKHFSNTLSRDINDYPEGIVVIIDKPYRWTSADVVRKLKFAAIRHFQKKNLKVGHAGTLDPLATGVLVLCIGNACKQAQALQDTDKEYIADVCFGATTPSYDLEKDVDRFYPFDTVTRESVLSMLPGFIGEQEQIAPLFSAKQVDGVRAYDLARKMHNRGEVLDDAAKELLHLGHIKINDIQLLKFSVTDSEYCKSKEEGSSCEKGASGRINVADIPQGLPVATLRISCSKGTYIRALARDLGERASSGAFLTDLRRTASGGHAVSDASDLESVLSIFKIQCQPSSDCQ